MLKYLALMAAVLIGGCATSFSALDQELPRLQGRSIKVAIDYLGIPDREYSIEDEKVYSWKLNETYVDSNGAVVPLYCQIKISTVDGIIKRTQYHGANGTCYKYSERLKPLMG